MRIDSPPIGLNTLTPPGTSGAQNAGTTTATPDAAQGIGGDYKDVPGAGNGFGSGGHASNGLTPGGGAASTGDTKAIEATLARIESSAGNALDFLARAMVEQEGKQRNEAMQDRTNMRMMAKTSLEAAAGELNKQAATMEQAAIVSLVVSCVSAAITVGAAAVGGGFNIAGAKETEGQGGNFVSKFSKIGEMIGRAGDGVTKAGEAGSNFASTSGKIDQTKSEANQKLDEADAQQYDAQADMKKSMQDSLDDMVKQIITFIKDQQDSKSERMAAFTKV